MSTKKAAQSIRLFYFCNGNNCNSPPILNSQPKHHKITMAKKRGNLPFTLPFNCVSNNLEISKRSRAARRATSPSINTDKSIKEITPPRETTSHKNSVLAVHNSAGVSKKTSKRKTHMTAKARKRQQRGMEMAEAVMDRTSKKMAVSKGRARTVQQRAKDWKDINKVLVVEGDDDDEQDETEAKQSKRVPEEEWETDEEMDAAEEAKESTAAPVLDDDLDEIL